jgi:hypothetical protein
MEIQRKFEGFAGISSRPEMRQFFQDEDLVAEGDIMKPEDFDMICVRAAVLARGGEVSGLEALKWAFLDRMAVNRETGLAIVEKIKPAVIQEMFKDRYNEVLSEEEVGLFLKHMISGAQPVSDKDLFTEWTKARHGATTGIAPVTAVVGKTDNVILTGSEPNKALRRAVDDTDEGKRP